MAKRGWRASKSWSSAEAGKALDAADTSGLSDERFAEREDINPQRLYYWRRKLDRTKRTAADKKRRAEATARKRRSRASKASTLRRTGDAARFVEVAAVRTERIEVQLRNGRLVAAPASIAPATLAALLDAIEGSGC